MVTEDTLNFKIEFGKQIARDILVGRFYSFKNHKTGTYLIKSKDLPQITLDKYNEKTICWFNISYTTKTNLYKLQWKEGTSKYISPLDVQAKEPSDNLAVYANPKDSATRDATQFWNISYNEDGTFCLYLKNSKNEIFALSAPDEGKIPVVKLITEVTDEVKWELVTDYYDTYQSPHTCTVTRDGNVLHIEGGKDKIKNEFDKVTISVYAQNGKSALATVEAPFENKKFTADVTVENLPDEYIVIITHKEVVDSVETVKYTCNATMTIRL